MAIEPDRWGVIYNPKAGLNKVKKRWGRIRSYMESKKVAFDYVQSEGFGSVERLSRTMVNNGYKIIVIVGGDGALNDALNGILSADEKLRDKVALGIIPNGIGNDFAEYWGLTLDFKVAVDCIIAGRQKKIDVGYCAFYANKEHKKRYFLNAANIGLGARIVRITDQTKRFWGVKVLSYLAALFLLIFERKLYRMHLRINDEHIRDKVMTVCIGSAHGYGLTPSAVPYNGWLDVSIIYQPQFTQLFSGLWLLIRGRILNHKLVKSYRTKHVRVLRARNAALDVDGRMLPSSFPLDIGISKEAFTMIIPK
ncbi:MAG: diacylglycerol kinase family protein [Bacteroidaceae bacterium]